MNNRASTIVKTTLGTIEAFGNRGALAIGVVVSDGSSRKLSALYKGQVDELIAGLQAARDVVFGAPAVESKAVPSMSPQAKLVLKHLQQKGSITNVEANAVHKVRALPRRIADLKANGYQIDREFNKDLTGQRYVRYSLVS